MKTAILATAFLLSLSTCDPAMADFGYCTSETPDGVLYSSVTEAPTSAELMERFDTSLSKNQIELKRGSCIAFPDESWAQASIRNDMHVRVREGRAVMVYDDPLSE